MLNKILNILLILSATTLIYISNSPLINVSLFLLIFLTIINKNYLSIFSIIPLFFINPNSFIIFVIIYLMLFLTSASIQNKLLKNSGVLFVSVIFFTYEILINNLNIKIVFLLILLLSVVLLINLYKESLSIQISFDMLILSLSMLNVLYCNIYLFLLIFMIFMIIEGIKFNKYYYIATSFLITIYSVVKTQNIIYIFIQMFAYLGYLLNFIKNKKHDNKELEYVLEDMNNNISNFCNFLNHFSSITYNNDYEKRVSTAIKILIESFCITCKNRSSCYASKKIKTYIYLKNLLTKKDQINSQNIRGEFFDCKYYFAIAEKALQLQKQYSLLPNSNIDDLKVVGICSSVQNYFVSVFEKISPPIIKLISFKKILTDQNIEFYNFEYSITDKDRFQFKIYSKKITNLHMIIETAKSYFKNYNVNIDLRENYVFIYPKKSFKIIYDSASLSLNNSQISGDNILIKTINDINFICALSDGMGSGYNAYQLSQETLKMVDNITNCNINFDTSLQILNSFFKTRDLSDSYATLDLVDVDLVNGILNLYKLGSSTTYLSRGNKIIPIYNNNLPFGISDLITKEEYKIVDSDLIVLVSDGINDYINEDVLIKYIESIQNEAPHKIVYEILQKIYYENKNTIKDDMTCVAIKLKEINKNQN